jgi:hypothetical protein
MQVVQTNGLPLGLGLLFTWHSFSTNTRALHSVTQRYYIPHDTSQLKSRLMDLFGRLDKCILRIRKGWTNVNVSRGMRLLFLTVPQILQQVMSIFVRNFATSLLKIG